MTTKELHERLQIAMNEIPALADEDVDMAIDYENYEPGEIMKVEDALYDEDSVTIYNY